MFTKHFYRVDEVQAALLYAVKKGRALEAAFWCEELMISGLWTQAWSTLVQGWLWFCLATNPNWIGQSFIEDSGILHQACYSLCQSKKDNSLWAVLASVDTEMPDRVCAKRPDGLTYESDLDAYLCAAICQGKAACAWWAIQKGGPLHRIPETPLTSCLDMVGLRSPLWIRIGLCANVLLACTPECAYDTSMNPAIQEQIEKWSLLSRKRQRRVYAIPDECLYGLTKRGCMERTETTLGELYTIQELLYDGTEDIEEFYARTFPDDIPDEWSLLDQRKSHGSGVLRTGEPITLAKLGRIWMTDPCIYWWGFQGTSSEEATGLEDIALLHMATGNDVVMDSLLKAVSKQLMII